MYASAFGNHSCATADCASAFGRKSCATSTYASTFGYNSCATGTKSTAVGFMSCATAVCSSVFGFHSCTTGSYSTALGWYSCATATQSSAFGRSSRSTGDYSVALGYFSVSTGTNSLAVGHHSTAEGGCASSFGYYSKATIACTVNISQPLIHKKDAGETAGGDFAQFSSAETTLMTKEIDLKTTACHTITIPTGATFFINEAGVISTAVTSLTTQATFKIGCATDATNTILENTQTTDLTAAKKRERYIPNNSEDGLQTITVEISTGATATTAKGRFYFKGMLVEDE